LHHWHRTSWEPGREGEVMPNAGKSKKWERGHKT